MSVGSAIAIYFVIWWIVLFPMLAIGDRRPDPEAERVAGTDRGAPAVAGLKRKMVLTTLISTLVFAALYGVLNSGLTLADIPLPSPPGLD